MDNIEKQSHKKSEIQTENRMKSIVAKYFNAFERKDLSTLRVLFHRHVTLRDWDIEVSGVDSVIAATKKF